MNLRELTDKAKGLFARRGGAQGVKQDAQELEDVATEDAIATDKGNDAVDVVKDPGVPGE